MSRAIRDMLVIGGEPATHSGAVYVVEVAGQVAHPLQPFADQKVVWAFREGINGRDWYGLGLGR